MKDEHGIGVFYSFPLLKLMLLVSHLHRIHRDVRVACTDQVVEDVMTNDGLIPRGLLGRLFVSSRSVLELNLTRGEDGDERVFS